MRGNLLWTKGSPPPFQAPFSGGAAGPAAERWERTTARGRGKQEEKAWCLPLPIFGTYGALRAQRTFERMSVQNKNAEAECLPRFCFGRRPLCRKPCLSCHFCRGTGNGGCPASYRGVHPPAQSALGGGWDSGEGGPLRASRRPTRRPQAVPVATKGATGIDSRARSLFPQKNLLTCGRSAGEARRGSCGRRPACGRRG